MMNSRKIWLPAVAAGLALGLAGCVEDEVLLPPPELSPEAELFSRYVSLGNSITAGFQSAGINEETQSEAYPVLLAEAAGVQFGVPILAGAGCPPPFAEPLGPTRVDGSTAASCALRVPGATFSVQNLAVPGARIMDLFDIGTERASILTTLFLGGRTQIEAMQQADPTLVSAWIGNNDALAAAVSGIVTAPMLTPLDAFEADLDRLVEAINQTDARGAVLIGVVDAVTAAPILQPGAYFWALGQQEGALPKPVNDNCAPTHLLGGPPNPLARNMVSFRILGDPNFPEINCSSEAFPEGDPRRGVHLLTLEEQSIVQQRIAEFNDAIEQRVRNADDAGWIFVDPNGIFAEFLMEGPPFDRVRKCQMIDGAENMSEFQRAVALSCPVPPQMGGAPNFFGSLISLDGVHPSAEAHAIIASRIADEINTAFGLDLAEIPVP